VRSVENLVREENNKTTEAKSNKPAAKPNKSETLVEYQKSLSDRFNTKISIKADDKGRGNIKIPFRSQSELQRILDLMQLDEN
jgi:ParB family chromosome partitioning protein